jgi:hypothetical protein
MEKRFGWILGRKKDWIELEKPQWTGAYQGVKIVGGVYYPNWV